MKANQRTINYGNGWSAKEIISPDGKRQHTRYFYKNRQAPRLVIKGKLAQQLAGYSLIEKDLRNALGWLNNISEIISPVELVEGSHISPDRNRFGIVKGLFIAVLTSYGKCFTTCEGRKIKLERSSIDADYISTHDELMHMRHNFAAHSGADDFEAVTVALLLPPKKNSGQPFWLSKELFQADLLIETDSVVENLIKHVQSKVLRKMEQLSEKILFEEILAKGEDYWYRKAK